MIRVPDRHVNVPGISGGVWVPGHWEQRLPEHEVYVPPLTGHTDDGGTIQLPARSRRGADERLSPRRVVDVAAPLSQTGAPVPLTTHGPPRIP